MCFGVVVVVVEAEEKATASMISAMPILSPKFFTSYLLGSAVLVS